MGPEAESNGISGCTVTRPLQLMPRDRAILAALTRCIKLMSIAQAVYWFWMGVAQQTACRRLARLAEAGFLEFDHLLVHAEIELLAPLAVWSPGKPQRDFAEILKVTKKRWSGPMQTVRCVVATQRSAAWLGCSRRTPRLAEGSHDIHLSQVFLRKLRNDPRLIKRWVGEAQFQSASKASKVPDALVCAPGHRMAVEVVGSSYGLDKLSAFHAYCESEGLSYELW